jgi:hypothetical protein
MIELRDDSLLFSFPEVHPDACLEVALQRTLRIPDDGRDYPLSPGLGLFPLRHVDDYADRLPAAWNRHGGVMLPMYQSEALLLEFRTNGYPFAIKVAAGKINAVTGERWRDGLNRDPQDYLVAHPQRWLDGYCAENGSVRQFVAMPLGAGYTAEEQITGEALHGGLQLMAFPLTRKGWKRMQVEWAKRKKEYRDAGWCGASPYDPRMEDMLAGGAMGLCAGGRMKQKICRDPHTRDEWDLRMSRRCFVHIANSQVWRAITGSEPPTVPATAEEYTRAGLPWFSYYAEEQPSLGGARVHMRMKSVFQLGIEKDEFPLPENQSVETKHVIALDESPGTSFLREGGVDGRA